MHTGSRRALPAAARRGPQRRQRTRRTGAACGVRLLMAARALPAVVALLAAGAEMHTRERANDGGVVTRQPVPCAGGSVGGTYGRVTAHRECARRMNMFAIRGGLCAGPQSPMPNVAHPAWFKHSILRVGASARTRRNVWKWLQGLAGRGRRPAFRAVRGRGSRAHAHTTYNTTSRGAGAGCLMRFTHPWRHRRGQWRG